MISYTSCPWAWIQGSRSTPTSSMYNLPFTSRFDKGISVESFYWWNTRWVWLVKSAEFTPIKEGIGSTHRGILETYTTSFESNYHQLESRAWLAKSENEIYQWNYVSGKELLEVFVYEGHCRMIFQQRIRRSLVKLMCVSAHNQRKKQCEGIGL